jgi:hypothetical protein
VLVPLCGGDSYMAIRSGGQIRIGSTEWMIQQINQLIHTHLDKEWMTEEWRKRESGADRAAVHPFVNVAFDAHQQMQGFIAAGTAGITPEIWEVTELAFKVNLMKERQVRGLDERLVCFSSHDFSLYRPTRYEIQIGGMLLERGYEIEFLTDGTSKAPDLLAKCDEGECEIECKYKQSHKDNLDFVRSIYSSTQVARRQFSKRHVGLIFVDIDQPNFDRFELERVRLEGEIFRAMRNSSSISGIFLTSKIALQEQGDFIYRHRVMGYASTQARHPIPGWLAKNLVN